jgi:hypothetical protein
MAYKRKSCIGGGGKRCRRRERPDERIGGGHKQPISKWPCGWPEEIAGPLTG